MLTRDDFGQFFAAVNEGHAPFAWQRRLLDRVLEDGSWPSSITAPTGTGKSNVVDIHVFANALCAVDAAPRVPRRLSVVVNRRAIVDQHHTRATTIAAALIEPGRTDVVERVRAALERLAPRAGEDSVSPLSVLSLRGGAPSERDWLDEPRRCLVISATPDMWGSRLLLRGYGTAPLARPREAGLLAFDSVVIVDEAHLSRQVVITANDVSALSRPGAEKIGVPRLQVVGTTATHVTAVDAGTVGVEERDVVGPAAEPLLARRMLNAKKVRIVETADQPTSGAASMAYVRLLVQRALDLRSSVEIDQSGATGTVGVVVNHVATAAKVANQLNRTHHRKVVTWVGRMRPMDLTRMEAEHPGVFSVVGCSAVEFLVTTQTAEVGVDLDLAAMVTELAPATALAQRFGRVNRLGLRPSSVIDVVVPSAAPSRDRPPYAASDLVAANEWLGRLARADGDASPWAITGPGGIHPPATTPTRLAWSRLRPNDADLLAQTCVPLFQEPDLTFWLRDDLADEVENVALVVRELPKDDASAALLVAAIPPVEQEVLPATIGAARSVINRVIGAGENVHERAFVMSPDAKAALPCRDAEDLTWLRPGATVVIDADHPLVVEGVVVDGQTSGLERLAALREFPGRLVLHGAEAASFLELDEVERDRRATELLGCPGAVTAADEAVDDDVDEAWVVLTSGVIAGGDESLRQVWTASAEMVRLEDHGRAVAERAELIADQLALDSACRDALRLGGLWHDAGKADRRFQRFRLGNLDPHHVLAKSHGVPPWQLRRQLAGLPARWRHEQLSAALAWRDVDAKSAKPLVTRLAGTSHGWGRPLFPHGSQSLIGDVESGDGHLTASQALFDGADWLSVIEVTHKTFGVWGCAYLEAILRAADGTVSREGR